jgi:hypothetical protein
MQYFKGFTNEEEIKAKYKELAKTWHPDLGGCTEKMKIINAQYEEVLTGKYQRDGKSLSEIDDLLQKDFILRSKMNEILGLSDLIVEVCGSWIWLTGNTKEHKDKIKEANFMWSHNKKAWYWRAEEKKCRFKYKHKPESLDSIRYRFGSTSVKTDNFSKIA